MADRRLGAAPLTTPPAPHLTHRVIKFRVVGGVIYAFLLLSGGLTAALAVGLAFVHRAVNIRPYLDPGGWVMLAYGLAALSACSIIDRDAAAYTVTLLVFAVLAAFLAGRRSCGPLLLLAPKSDPDAP